MKKILTLILLLLVICFTGCENNNNEYTVKFNTDGGTEIATQIVEENNSIKITTEPKKIGYEFAGWYLDSSFQNMINLDAYQVKENVTIYAKWVLENYNITYQNVVENCNNPTSYNITTSDIILNNPTKEGYEFVGWYNGDNKLEKISQGTTGNLELVAKWNLIDYTIIYYNDGISVDNPMSYNIETNDIVLNNPTKEGYEFAGWYNGDDKIEVISRGTTGNLELVAKWNLIEYTINFNSNGGNNIEPAIVKHGEKVQLVQPIRDGYDFTGWYTDSDCTKAYDFDSEVKANLTLYAKWEKKIVYITVTFDVNGGDKLDENSLTLVAGNKINELAIPTRIGYEFIGWYNGIDEVTTETEILESITLVAKWNKLSYNLKLINDGQTYSEELIPYGNKLNLPTLSKEDYKFLGWYEGEKEVTYKNMPAQNLELVAKWKQEYTTYSISYELDGGKWPRDVAYDSRESLVTDLLKDMSDGVGHTITATTIKAGSGDGSSSNTGFRKAQINKFLTNDQLYNKWSWFFLYLKTLSTNEGAIKVYDEILTKRTANLNAGGDLWYFVTRDIHNFVNKTCEGFMYNAGTIDFTNEAIANSYYEYLPGDSVEIIESYTYVSEDIVLPIPTKEGYIFGGWFDQDGNKVETIKTGSRGNVILEVKWDVITYTISYELNGGSSKNLIYEYNSALTTKLYLPASTKEGYAFLGYYKDSEFKTQEVLFIEPGSAENYKLYARWAKEQLGSHKTISFYGDSISTYENYVPSDAVFYYPTYSSTVKNPDLTWWKQLMELTGTTLHTNVSYSGSTVSGSSTSCGQNSTRISKILKDGEAPDILVIYLGINDVVSGVSKETFKTAYENMLNGIREKCPNTQIIICNLPYETASDGTGNAGTSMIHIGLREEINKIIEDISIEQNIPLVDLASLITKETDSFGNKTYIGDNIHPNAAGMTVIANAVSEVLKKIYN